MVHSLSLDLEIYNRRLCHCSYPSQRTLNVLVDGIYWEILLTLVVWVSLCWQFLSIYIYIYIKFDFLSPRHFLASWQQIIVVTCSLACRVMLIVFAIMKNCHPQHKQMLDKIMENLLKTVTIKTDIQWIIFCKISQKDMRVSNKDVIQRK